MKNKTNRFVFSGVVRRTVIDTITIAAHGDSEEEAAENARKVLQDYPEPAENLAYWCYIEDRDNVDSEVLSLQGMNGEV